MSVLGSERRNILEDSLKGERRGAANEKLKELRGKVEYLKPLRASRIR
jgi:hypothetical protein